MFTNFTSVLNMGWKATTVRPAMSIQVASPGLAIGPAVTVEVIPGPPATADLEPTPSRLTAGACSGAQRVRLLDAHGHLTTARTPLSVTVTIDPSAGAGVYAVPTCSGG
jgi:hypothetical protein